MWIPGSSRSSEVGRHASVLPTSPSWCGVFGLAWRALGAWVAPPAPVGQGPIGSSGRQPQPGVGVGGMSTAAGPGGGAVRGGTLGASPPVLPPREPAPAVTTHSVPGQRRVEARHCAQLPALIASLSSLDREIVLLRVVAGVSVPGIVAALGVTPAAIHLAQDQALSALQPAASAHGPPPTTRVRVVLLPHAEATDTRAHHRRTGRANGMNQDGSSQQDPTPSGDTTRGIAASTQWHDVELAMTVARHSLERWLVADHEDTPSAALMHACHTHTALHEAARATAVLIETFRAEAAALITSPAQGTGIPTQRR
jgi:hypothetical protein